jgi:branched-chain amino acid transport system permease protein
MSDAAERASATAAVPALPAAARAPTRRALLSPAVLAALTVAVGYGLVASDYRLFVGCMVLSYAIAILGVNILTGYNGQISLGHGAFYALGAYSAAILMDRLGVPYGLAIPVAGAICLAAGYLFGFPALKLEGLYLALATYALGVALPQLLKYRRLEAWTGGVGGIVLTKPEAPFGLPLSPDQWLYALTLAVTLLMFFLARNLLDGGTGRAIVAVRENPIAAETMGVNIAQTKAITFGVSALFTGVGGALSALAVQFVAPDSFGAFLSISLLVGVVVGGVGTISGALFGALFIQFVPTWAERLSKAAPWAIYGAVLIVFVFVLPGGVVGGLRRLRGRLARPRGA